MSTTQTPAPDMTTCALAASLDDMLTLDVPPVRLAMAIIYLRGLLGAEAVNDYRKIEGV
jgi:hypothetical protein